MSKLIWLVEIKKTSDLSKIAHNIKHNSSKEKRGYCDEKQQKNRETEWPISYSKCIGFSIKNTYGLNSGCSKNMSRQRIQHDEEGIREEEEGNLPGGRIMPRHGFLFTHGGCRHLFAQHASPASQCHPANSTKRPRWIIKQCLVLLQVT